MNATETKQMKTVGVISWAVQYGGQDTAGGFDWYADPNEADRRFDDEVRFYEGTDSTARVRLLHVSVPAHLDGQELTEYLDNDIDQLEHYTPALRDVTTK